MTDIRGFPVITIGKDFEIKRDKNCWEVVRISHSISKKTGEPTTGRKSRYYNSLGHALQRIIDEKAGYAESLDSVVEHVDQAKEEVIQELKKYGLPQP